MQPQPHRFVAQTENRAATIPWIEARATISPAGLLACGSKLGHRLPRCASVDAASQWPLRSGSMTPSLTAHSCRDSRGFGGRPPAPHSHSSPFRGTGAIIERRKGPRRGLSFVAARCQFLKCAAARSARHPRGRRGFSSRRERHAGRRNARPGAGSRDRISAGLIQESLPDRARTLDDLEEFGPIDRRFHDVHRLGRPTRVSLPPTRGPMSSRRLHPGLRTAG